MSNNLVVINYDKRDKKLPKGEKHLDDRYWFSTLDDAREFIIDQAEGVLESEKELAEHWEKGYEPGYQQLRKFEKNKTKRHLRLRCGPSWKIEDSQ